MQENIFEFFKNRRSTFSFERIICRLIAAWCGFAAITLFAADGDFSALEFAQNVSFFKAAFSVLAFFAAYTFINLLLNAFETDSWLLLLASTVCVGRWLSVYSVTEREFLFTLAVIAAYSLFVVYCVRKNDTLLQKWQPNKATVWSFAIAAGLICGSVIGAVTCYRYLSFSSPNFDFGLFVNMFHNMKETGLPMVTSERDVLMSHFAVHISPIYYLLLPFYCIFPSPLTLQIGQAVVLASGIVPVVLLCRQLKVSGKATLLVTLMYALYPAMSAGCFYDIHENCFLTPLLLWTFYFFEKEKYPLMYLFAFLTLCVKEDAAIYVILFALFLMLSRRKPLHGWILMLTSAAYFATALVILQRGGNYYAELYANASPNPAISGPMINRFNNLIFDSGSGLLGAIKTAIVNPGYLLTQLFTTPDNGWEKVIYFIQLFLPLGLIPFVTKKASRWLLIVPVLMNLLTNYQYQYDVGFQYHYGITAFLIYVTVLNLPDLHAPTRKTLLSIAAVACCCLYLSTVLPSLSSNYERYESGKENYKQMEAILDTIPEDASVCCSTMLLAHIADRDEIYELKYHGNEGDVDYIVIDGRRKDDVARVRAFTSQGYTVKEEHEGLIIILTKDTASAK